MKEKRILRIEDLLELIPVSRATFDRWIREARQGLNDFPTPLSLPGRRILFDAQAVEAWIENRNKASPTPTPPPTKIGKRKAREFDERQERAAKALERHNRNRNR